MLTDHESTGSHVLARRRWRARAWLVVTVALHVSMLVLTLALLPQGRIDRIDPLVIIVALAVGPPAGVLWLERRRSSTHQPHKWPWRSLAAAFPQTVALGFAVNGVLDKVALAAWLRLLLILAVPLIPALIAAMAVRSLLRPLVPELGTRDFEVIVAARTGHRSFFYGDFVALTDREIVITVRSGSGRATWNPKVERIALADITAVGTRPMLPQDSPWITLSDGRGLTVPPGDVVVVQCRASTAVLPVTDAGMFAEIVRVRAARVRGTSVAPAALAGHSALGGHSAPAGRTHGRTQRHGRKRCTSQKCCPHRNRPDPSRTPSPVRLTHRGPVPGWRCGGASQSRSHCWG